MSAPYGGQSRSSYDNDDITSLYLQAVDTFHNEEQELNGTRTPVGTSAPAGTRDQGHYENPAQQSSYLRSPPQPAPPRTPGGGRSRPLPVLPGGAMPPRPVIPPNVYGVDEKTPRSSTSSYQTSHTGTYQTRLPPQIYLETKSNYGVSHHPPSQYSPHRSNEPEYAPSNSSHNSYPPEKNYNYYNSKDDSYSKQQQYYSDQGSRPDPNAYGYRGTSPNSTSHVDHGGMNGAMKSTNVSQGYSSHDNYYTSQSNGYANARSAQPPAPGTLYTSPQQDPNYATLSPSAVPQDDPGYELGMGLMRSTSTSSYASVDSLLREPRAASTDESNLLTPTSSKRNPILYGQPTGASTAAQNTYSRDTYSSHNMYNTPAIVTTVIEPGQSSSRRHRNYERMASMKAPLGLHADEEEEEDDEELEEDRFVNLSLLSHLANRLRDRVPRGTHVKGSIPYPMAFTGKDIVTTIQTQIQKEFQNNMGFQVTDRRAALQVARSLQSQLFFYEVEWGGRLLQDGLEDVYMFLDDNPGSEGATEQYRMEREELPTGVITLLTKCYAPSCQDGSPCYSYSCPRRESAFTLESQLGGTTAAPEPVIDTPWGELVDQQTLSTLPESEVRRQTIIAKVIGKEQQYVQDLDLIETIFIKELRRAKPPIIRGEDELEEFIQDVFGNFYELRQCNKRLLDVMLVRQREQGPIIQRIGDIFLQAAAEFRMVYPTYVGNLPVAEKRIKEEAENNAEFRRFLEQSARVDARGLDMKHFIYRPSEHLQKYPVLLEAIFTETAEGNPDADFLREAEHAIRNLSSVAQLRTFQSAMGRGPTGKWEWHDVVPKEIRASVAKQEGKRQSIIWELIKGEMIYVKDLETIETLFIRPLRESEIIPRDRLPTFLQDVFHNFAELHGHHRRMLDSLYEIQREEHPFIRSITAPVFDAALNWRDAYLEYIPHYPIAAFRIDDEMANNASFKAFIEQCTRHPDSRKLDLKAFINRPIPRLLRYELLLKSILEVTPPGHDDLEAIPNVLEVIKDLGKATEPGVQAAKQKVELWRYHADLVFKPGEFVDMDLLDETRVLIHTGKLLRQPENGFDITGGWSELFVLLFDNYLVMTKQREKDGVIKYHVNRRPIPLDLLSLLSFNDPPSQRSTGLLRPRARTVQSIAGDPNAAAGSANDVNDNRYVYPLQIHHNGRSGGVHTFFTETAQARQEWKMKLEEARGLRSVVQESNKVFEIETLSVDTFLVPSLHQNMSAPSWNEEGMFTGNVTCSVPFTTNDGRHLVAIGCAEGVWIGLRHDSKSMRRVLHLKLVTQCAMLEDFGIFLVLADKSLFAYHIEALVPSTPPSPHSSRPPQKLNGNKEVQFFSVGTMGGRTLIIYMKKKGLESVFRVLEPVVEHINEKARAPGGLGRFAGFGNTRSEWFRIFRDFFLPCETFDLYFLKAKIAICCTRGFEVMDLADFKSVTIPQREDPRLLGMNKRLETAIPLGMFRSSESEFLLCYKEFGMYVNRHGDPSRAVLTVEWEGSAEKVACHPPYILLFDTRFIEIRHIETGRLAQIIPGRDVRCLWDGRGGSAPPILTPGPDGWQEGGAQDARVHATMRAQEVPNLNGPMRTSSKGVAQHVFELLPTIPLYLPGSLASPSQSTYFPQSNSPPHSPRLNPAWRG